MINNNVITIATQSAQLSSLQGNALQLEQELVWCEQVIDTRIKLYFEQESVHASVFDLKAPSVNDSQSCYGDFISRHNLDFVERLTLILALLPAVKPKILDIFLSQNEQTNKPYTEFGCLELDGSTYATGETLAFLLGGGDLAQRLKVQAHLQPYAKQKAKTGIHQLLYWQPNQNDPLLMKTPLQLAPEYLYLFTTAQPYRPDLSEDFPAQFVSADMSWDDLILPDNVMAQLQEIQSWIKHGDTLMHDWGLAKKIRPGYRALFHGPPGTGKTLTACLLGKTMGQDVYKVDLSMIMSKYIGETEKNLEKVFALAEDKSWILFFDEADALFGKRTQTANANDQFANQNVSYLLQRIERFNGIAILATNYKDNLDSAFFRRFESVIDFPLPGTAQRLQLWQQGFSKKSRLAETINLNTIAANHALSGAAIMNVIRFVSMQALSDGRCEISSKDLDEGIRREMPQRVTLGW